jgi:uncharacterized protein YndB with AHSA1/START domain
MQTLHSSIVINAPKEKVWHSMLDEATYREWTKAFNVDSTYQGSWEQGAEIRFVGPDPKTGEMGGMASRIAENRQYEFMSIQHIGIIHNGEIDTTSEEAKKWTPAFENYTFTEVDGGTELSVDVDVEDEYAEEFQQMWTDALARLKAIAER